MHTDQDMSDPAAQVIEAERQWLDAHLKLDLVLLDRLMADEYLQVNDRGELLSKQQVLASMVAGGQRASTQGYLTTTRLATSVFGFIGTGDGKWLAINPRPLQMKSGMRRRTYLTDPHPQRLKLFKANFLDNSEVSPTLITHYRHI